MAGERLRGVLVKYQRRYQAADRQERSRVLDEFTTLTGYHRKYAIALLRRRVEAGPPKPRRRRGNTYTAEAVRVLERIWEAADYPWSERLKALLPLWLPWARKHVRGCTEAVEKQLLAMSARQMDRRLAGVKRVRKRRIYGRTKPGTLLKHHIPIKTDNWDVSEPGHCDSEPAIHPCLQSTRSSTAGEQKRRCANRQKPPPPPGEGATTKEPRHAQR